MKRKIFAALIAVMMVVSMLPLSVMAADITVTTKEQLVAAVATPSANIILGADIELDGRLTISEFITIDLNGHTISGDFEDAYGTVYVRPAGYLTIDDSSEAGTGAITSTKTYAIGNYGHLNITAGSFNSTGTYEVDGETYSYPALYNFYNDGSTYGWSDIYGGTYDEIWNCGVAVLSGAEVGYFDNSGSVALMGDVVIDEFIARDGTDASGKAGIVDWYGTNVIKNAVDENGEFVDVYEQYDAPTYNVVFDPNGGSFVDETTPSKVVTPGKVYGELPTVTKEGYKFVGWYIREITKEEIEVNSLLRDAVGGILAVAEESGETVTYSGPVEEDDIVDITYKMENYSEDQGIYIVLKAFWEEVEKEPEEIKPEKPEPKFDMPRLNLRSIVIDTTEGGKTSVASGRCYGALGSTYRLAITPDEGFEIDEVLVNGKPAEVNKNNKVSFVVKGNTYVEVSFVEIEG